MVTYVIRYRIKDKKSPYYRNGHWYVLAYCGDSGTKVKQSFLNIQLRNLHRDWKNREFKACILDKNVIRDEKAAYNY